MQRPDYTAHHIHTVAGEATALSTESPWHFVGTDTRTAPRHLIHAVDSAPFFRFSRKAILDTAPTQRRATRPPRRLPLDASFRSNCRRRAAMTGIRSFDPRAHRHAPPLACDSQTQLAATGHFRSTIDGRGTRGATFACQTSTAPPRSDEPSLDFLHYLHNAQ